MTLTQLMLAKVEARKSNIRAFILWCDGKGLNEDPECQAAGRRYKRLTEIESYLEDRYYR